MIRLSGPAPRVLAPCLCGSKPGGTEWRSFLRRSPILATKLRIMHRYDPPLSPMFGQRRDGKSRRAGSSFTYRPNVNRIVKAAQRSTSTGNRTRGSGHLVFPGGKGLENPGGQGQGARQLPDPQPPAPRSLPCCPWTMPSASPGKFHLTSDVFHPDRATSPRRLALSASFKVMALGSPDHKQTFLLQWERARCLTLPLQAASAASGNLRGRLWTLAGELNVLADPWSSWPPSWVLIVPLPITH